MISCEKQHKRKLEKNWRAVWQKYIKEEVEKNTVRVEKRTKETKCKLRYQIRTFDDDDIIDGDFTGK